MTGSAFVEALLVGVGFLIVALALGGPLVSLLDRVATRLLGTPPESAAPSLARRLGAALLAGLGTEAAIGVVLGLLGIFSLASLLLCALAAVFIGHRTLVRETTAVLRGARGPRDRFTTACLAAAALLYALTVAAAMTPPYASDELAYHLPQAELIARGGELPLTVGDHYFYGNIPKLVEVLYAEAIVVSGIDAPHMVHVAIIGAFLLFVFGALRGALGPRPAAAAVLLVLLYDEFTWNASTAFIDAATVSFEIAALISAATFAATKRPGDAALAVLFSGFALAAKYSALASFAFIAGVLIAATLIHYRLSVRRLALFVCFSASIVVATAGFWYAKNLVRFGNPTYPLFFGHTGVVEQEYLALLADVQRFGPRTLWDFLAIPSRFATSEDLPLMLSLIVSPLALLVRRQRVMVLVLFFHVAWYSAYWFFLGSHQLRFFMPAGVTASILAAVALTCAPARTLPIVGVLAAFTAFVAFPHVGRTLVASPHIVAAHKLQAARLLYPLGLESREEFLTKQLGCQYRVIRYLERAGLSGKVIDNWSIWHDTPIGFYARRNEFVSFTSESRDPAVIFTSLRHDGIRFLYLRSDTKERFAQNPDPLVAAYRAGRDEVEEIILARAKLLLKTDECQLFVLPRSVK